MATRGDDNHVAGESSFHAVRPEAFNYVWDNSIEPVLEVDSGEVVEFTVRDASDEQIQANSTSEDVAKLDFDHVNPVSGPVSVRGARPGDVLAVEILEFRPREWGWTALIPGFGLLADEFPEPWLRISREEAYALCSVAVDLRIHDVVDAPNWVVGAFLPDDIFTGGGNR